MDCVITTTDTVKFPQTSVLSMPTVQEVFSRIKTIMIASTEQSITNSNYAGSSNLSFIPATNTGISKFNLAYNDSSITYIGSCEMAKNLNERSIEKLFSFLTFEPDWNGYGAVPFSTNYILKVKKLLEAMPVRTEVFPIPDGRVQFEYRKTDGAYMEIEINNEGTIEVFSIAADKAEQEYSAGYSDIVRIVNDFYG